MNPTTRQVMRQWTLAQPVIASYITALVRDFAVRDDLLQDVAVAVLESVDRYDPSKPFIGWALGITRNILRNHFRRSSRDRLIFDDELTGKLAVAFEHASPTTLSQLDHLEDCLPKLEGRAREICTLRYSENLKPAAIAERLGMRANSVAKSLQRIRERLRDCINSKTPSPRPVYE
jgi:RNA polymerase sigma-70 factor (ECF subfamily)